MTRTRISKGLLLFSFAFVSTFLAGGQTATPPPRGSGMVTRSANRPRGVTSPVPPALTFGRKLFLSNGGADAGLFPHPFTGTQDRGYGQMYTLLAANAAFRVVPSPADADLVLELRLNAPLGSLGGDKQSGTEDPLPSFKLVIYDRPTHYILWTISQTIDKAALQRTHDKNFDDALQLLVNQFVAVAGIIP